MKKFMFILSIVIFIIPAIAGIILFAVQREITFTALGLTMVGIIGLAARLVLILYKKRMKKFAQQDYENSTEYRISQNISAALEEAKEAGAEQEKNKKLTCKFCKCTFDSYLDKCPNCGAPPEREN